MSEDLASRIALLEQRGVHIDDKIDTMSDDIKAIRSSLAEFLKSNQDIALLKMQAETLGKSIDLLWSQHRALEKSVQEDRLASGKAAKNAVMEIAKTGLLVAASVLAGHFGIKMLGG
jgi:regulator of replication initiation timing